MWNVKGSIDTCLGGEWEIPFSELTSYDIYVFAETWLTPPKAEELDNMLPRVLPSYNHHRVCMDRKVGQIGRDRGGASV
jgi:hypothetical protein